MKNDNKREHWTYRRSEIAPGDAVILDIDGVLADATGRQHHLERNDWRGFFEDVDEDPVIADTLLDRFTHTAVKITVTGDSYRKSEGVKLDLPSK